MTENIEKIISEVTAKDSQVLCREVMSITVHHASGVLVFYVHGHMFSFFDCDNFGVITLKCQPERIEELKAQYDCIGKPYNESPKYWIGIDASTAPDDILQELTRNSYEIVKAKYKK